MIFVAVQSCFGEPVYHTGLPFVEPNYMTYAAQEAVVPPNRFTAGQVYAMFIEFPHVVDSVVINGRIVRNCNVHGHSHTWRDCHGVPRENPSARYGADRPHGGRISMIEGANAS